MSEFYNFSPCLQKEIQMCLAASRKDDSNKWLKRFGHINVDYALKSTLKRETAPESLINLSDASEKSENDHSEVSKDVDERTNVECRDSSTEVIEEIIESLESEFDNFIKLTIEKCCENHMFLTSLAERLSLPIIQKFCGYIFNNTNLGDCFISKFFEYFLPVCIKINYNASALDILIKSNKMYSKHCKMLLHTIIKSAEFPTNVIQDYVLTLNEKERTIFLLDLSEIEINSGDFIRNLFAIYTAYKDCSKNEQTQTLIFTMLLQYSMDCVLDRNYGRLLLSYLQAEKVIKSKKNYEDLSVILEIHRSPFKRPCVTLITELMGKKKCEPENSDEDSD